MCSVQKKSLQMCDCKRKMFLKESWSIKLYHTGTLLNQKAEKIIGKWLIHNESGLNKY